MPILQYLAMDLKGKYKQAFSKLISAKRVLILGHISPDPDALSSMSAVMEFLHIHNVACHTFVENKIDGLYGYIPHEDKISSEKPLVLSDYSVVVALDCGSLSRTGLEKEINTLIADKRRENNTPYFIEFDHHQPQDKYADLEIRLPEKAATTEILYDFFQANNWQINKKIADCILIGLISDTGHFIHPNSSFQALEISSQMLLKGASLKKISQYISGGSSLAAIKLWGRVFSRVKFNRKTRMACTVVFQQDLKDLGVDRSELSDIFGDMVSYISYLPKVDVALLLKEESGVIKGSLRANNNNDIDVSKLAALFGGGGHKRAAGFSAVGSLKETEFGWKIIKSVK